MFSRRVLVARGYQRRIRVRRGFEERQAGRDHEQRDEEHPVLRHRRGRKNSRQPVVEQQADEDRRLVAEFLHDGRGRNREEEVAEIERGLHECRFEIGQEERLLELRDQYVVQVRGGAPQREQAAQQREREERRAVQVIAVGVCSILARLMGVSFPIVSSMKAPLTCRRRGGSVRTSRCRRTTLRTEARDRMRGIRGRVTHRVECVA